MSFESSLAAAIAAGDPSSATVSTTPSTDAAGVNGNNVSLDASSSPRPRTSCSSSWSSGALTSTYGLMSTVLQG